MRAVISGAVSVRSWALSISRCSAATAELPLQVIAESVGFGF